MKNSELVVYGVYTDTKPSFRDVYLLVLDFDDYLIEGIMFNKKTLEMECLFTIQNQHLDSLTRVGGIYLNRNFKLKLERLE